MSLISVVVILAVFKVLAETTEAEMRVMYDSTLPTSTLSTMIVIIGFFL